MNASGRMLLTCFALAEPGCSSDFTRASVRRRMLPGSCKYAVAFGLRLIPLLIDYARPAYAADMAGTDFNFTSAARSLALPIDDSEDDPALTRSTSNQQHRQTSPTWARRSFSDSVDRRPQTRRDKWMQEAEKWQRRAVKTWYHLSPIQRAGLVVFNIGLIIFAILFLVYNERIFAWLSPAAKSWRNLSGGWLILWFMTFFTAFPPMIGYSTCVTIAGFVFGMQGWFIVATANVAGSICSFIISRTVLKEFVGRLTEKNTQFAALSLVIKHDGLKLLTMIRLCPLPYSLSNGAISTIPTVKWQDFGLATAIASPKLLLHIFVGSRLGDLAENGDKMDTKTRIVSYLSIIIGMVAGIATGYFVYVRTKARAKQLEAEEATAARAGPRTSNAGPDYIDDSDEQDARNALRRGDDDISLHHTYEDDLEGGGGYRDEFTDDEDAQERDVFDVGDGYESEETPTKKSER
ncbi:Tlg2-vesicle protein [Saxophila tyrrhenica]|uniref:Golgi apparatus membrane protein TVP38 n=1 Tax=Saxophila tyrrhenica TaxID=1690608 RepID=A0AAV9PHH0_9PEZI|nr:Tlg2-vesicle protein [Saxophila tyrrhenica]